MRQQPRSESGAARGDERLNHDDALPDSSVNDRPEQIVSRMAPLHHHNLATVRKVERHRRVGTLQVLPETALAKSLNEAGLRAW